MSEGNKGPTKGGKDKNDKSVPPSHAELYRSELTILSAARAMSSPLKLKAPSLVFALDEVGRGCLAGDVVTGLSVWLSLAERDDFVEGLIAAQDRVIAQVKDSKKLTEKSRDRIFADLYSLSSPFRPNAAENPTKEDGTSNQDTAESAPRSRILDKTSSEEGDQPSAFVQETAVLHFGETTPFATPSSKFFTSKDKVGSPPAAHKGFVREPGAGSSGGQSPASTEAPAAFVPPPSDTSSLILLGLFVTSASAAEVDALGIWGATELSMTRSLLVGAAYARETLGFSSIAEIAEETLVLVDGDRELRFPKNFQPAFEAVVVKGDLRLKSIGAASIAAKVARDDLMVHLATLYPGYFLEQHAGYGTQKHYEALKLLGPSPIHRKSFRLS